MTTHLVRIAALAALIVPCMLLPYFPGGYDRFAVTLSTMAQMLGFAGPLLIPVGGLWLIVESRKRQGGGFYFAIAALLVASLVAAIVALGAFITQGLSLALGALALWVYGVVRMMPALKELRTKGPGRFNPAPVYLVVVPAVVSLAQFSLLGAATDFSRNYAIQRAPPSSATSRTIPMPTGNTRIAPRPASGLQPS